MTENKRFEYSDVWGWNIDGFLNVMNGLDRKNNELKERIKELEKEIQRLKWSNKILRVNKKDCEFGRREERKRWVKMDEMRIEHIQLLQKRLKENGLSIYVYGDDVDD